MPDNVEDASRVTPVLASDRRRGELRPSVLVTGEAQMDDEMQPTLASLPLCDDFRDIEQPYLATPDVSEGTADVVTPVLAANGIDDDVMDTVQPVVESDAGYVTEEGLTLKLLI